MSNARQPREPIIPENGDAREEQGHQVQRGLWKRASHDRFSYSQEKVDKADIRSLDRVWERLEEHVTRNNTSYQENQNVPALSNTQPEISRFDKKQRFLTHQTRGAFPRQIGNIAALFFVIVLVGSLLLVFQAVQHANSTAGRQSDTQAPVASSKTVTPGKQFIAIATQKNGTYQFRPATVGVTLGQLIIWQNQTPAIQMVMAENATVAFKILPKEYKAVVFNETGTCLLHLQAQPTAVVAILVGKNAPPAPPPDISICAFRPATVDGLTWQADRGNTLLFTVPNG